MATSKVLGDDDLLGEILIRLDSPTSLVRAALVSKRWLHHASHRAFLRRFRALRPPRLLGFFVTGDCMPRPEFVAMPAPAPEPQDPKFSAALRHASSVFDAFPTFSSRVWDSRNGRVLFDFTETPFGTRRFGVSDPLRHPGQGVAELPPPPPDWPQVPHAMLLADGEHDDASCYRVDIEHTGGSRKVVSAQVSVLRCGAWTVLSSAWTELDRPPDRIPMLDLLAGGKLYTVAVAGYIICMDLAAASLSVVEFPEGVAYEYYGNLVPCRGDNSVLYLFHVQGDRLSVWLRRMDEHDAEWVLRDTISLRETCGHLVEQVEQVDVVGVGDNAEFVFLELWRNNGDDNANYDNNDAAVVHMHLRSRRVEKVYQRDPHNDEMIHVHPLLTAWPPAFPALDQGEEWHQGYSNLL